MLRRGLGVPLVMRRLRLAALLHDVDKALQDVEDHLWRAALERLLDRLDERIRRVPEVLGLRLGLLRRSHRLVSCSQELFRSGGSFACAVELLAHHVELCPEVVALLLALLDLLLALVAVAHGLVEGYLFSGPWEPAAGP